MDIEQLIDLYISLKRIFYGKPFIPKPKSGSTDYNNLTKLFTLLLEQGIPYDEFILVNVRAYRRKKVFPSPVQLLGIKAFNRYSEYVNKRYKTGQLFRVDPHSVFIYKTNVYYPIEEFLLPFEKDQKVILIWVFAKEGKVEFEKEKFNKIWEIYQYVLGKYEWFKQTPPDSLLEWGKKLDALSKTKNSGN